MLTRSIKVDISTHNIKDYAETEVQLHPFLISALCRHEASAESPSSFTPGKMTGTLYTAVWPVPKTGLDISEKILISHPCRKLNQDSPTVQPVAQSSIDCVISVLSTDRIRKVY